MSGRNIGKPIGKRDVNSLATCISINQYGKSVNVGTTRVTKTPIELLDDWLKSRGLL